jgi:endo-1,4-beta-xylanase
MRNDFWKFAAGAMAGGAALALLTVSGRPSVALEPAKNPQPYPVVARQGDAANGNRPLPPNGTPALASDTLSAFTLSGAVGNAKVERVKVTGQPFAEAVRLTTLAPTPTVYGVQLSAKPIVAVKRGDTLLLTFYVRTIKGQAENGEARTQAVFERNSDPYTKAVTYDVSIPASVKGWKRYDVPFKAAEDLTADESVLHFRMGYPPQIFEIGGIALTKWGPEVALSALPRTLAFYPGMESDAAWRKDAEKRIEKIRKGDLSVNVVDAAGKSVSGAIVAVRMKRHSFGFGSAVAAEALLQPGADGDKYRDFVATNFNRVVMENDLKWPQWEENPERSKRGVAWLREKGIEVRGHNLVWPGWRWLPRDLEGLKNDKTVLAKRVTNHINSIVPAMRGQLVEWDVVNEPFANHDIQDILGEPVLIEWFKLARANDPTAVLYLNDYPTLDGSDKQNAHLNHFEKTIRYLKDGGAPIGGIGFQGHYGGNVTPPVYVLSGLDRFAKFGLPIAITEFDMNTTDTALQSAYMRDFLTACFSHPAVNQVIMWGFWEGRHWLPDAALFNRDWTIRPHGQVWLDMVKKTWWTNADGTTNGRGDYKTRGFLGDYEITVTANSKTKTVPVKLEQRGSKVTVVLD